jgi:hypothetical protein
MTVPSMTSRVIAAMIRPMASPTPNSCGRLCASSLENSTSTPEGTSSETWSMTDCFVSGVTSCWRCSKTTFATAVVSSVETVRIPEERSSSCEESSSFVLCSSIVARLSVIVACWASSAACCWVIAACWASNWACAAAGSVPPAACCACASAALSCVCAAVSCCWPASSCACPSVSCVRPASTCALPSEICFAWSAIVSWVSKGLTVESTPLRSAVSSSSSPIAVFCDSVKASPSFVWKTIAPVPPDALGNDSSSWSVTFAVGVPGMVTALDSVPPNARNAPTEMPRITIQEMRTAHARRAEKRPRRYSSSAKGVSILRERCGDGGDGISAWSRSPCGRSR